MNLLVVDLLYGLASITMGAVAASWLWCSHYRRMARARGGAEARHADEVLARLQELAARVACDVADHSRRANTINDDLKSADRHEPAQGGPAPREAAKMQKAGAPADTGAAGANAGLTSAEESNSIARFWGAYRDCGECPPWSSASDVLAPVMERREGRSVQEPPKIVQVQLDEISGLPSRTTFCQQVQNWTAQWKRGGPTFSVILADVDHYEQGGEDCGQRIREAATLATRRFLVASVREMDVLGSYAPGCFGLLLPMTGLADAFQVAERLREEFSQYVPAAPLGRSRLTLSVGVAQVTEKDDASSLLKRAEAALDAADRRGGNRAYYHDGEHCAPILETMDSLA